jgi:hypothetical protein
LLFPAIDLLLRAVLRGRSDAQGQSQPLDRKDGKVGRRRKVRDLGFESHFQKIPGAGSRSEWKTGIDAIPDDANVADTRAREPDPAVSNS